VCETHDFSVPLEVSLSDCDRERLQRLEAGLGELLGLARQARPLLEIAVAFLPKDAKPNMITAATVRKRVRAWLRLPAVSILAPWCASGSRS
jgi:hypothetical protein